MQQNYRVVVSPSSSMKHILHNPVKQRRNLRPFSLVRLVRQRLRPPKPQIRLRNLLKLISLIYWNEMSKLEASRKTSRSTHLPRHLNTRLWRCSGSECLILRVHRVKNTFRFTCIRCDRQLKRSTSLMCSPTTRRTRRTTGLRTIWEQKTLRFLKAKQQHCLRDMCLCIQQICRKKPKLLLNTSVPTPPKK